MATTSGGQPDGRPQEVPANEVVWQRPTRSFGNAVSTFLGFTQPNDVAAAIARYGLPEAPGTPLEEASTLLRIAAAAEHALMVQYLYSSYSMDEDFLLAFQGDPGELSPIGLAAIQEMGHLIAVQNLRLLLGGEPTLVRQDQAMAEDEYPFPYVLEPFSRQSLAKYLVAESPSRKAEELPADVREFIRHALGKLDEDGDGLPDLTTRPVGLIYAKLYWLLQADDNPAEWPQVAEAFSAYPIYRGRHIAEEALSPASADRQTLRAEWGQYASTRKLTIDEQPLQDRAAARRLLHAIAEQGEGYEDNAESHFRAFAGLQTFLATWTGRLARPWPSSPTLDPNGNGTPIANPSAAALAAVANAVYEALLHTILAGLSVPRDPEPGPEGPPGPRSTLFRRNAYELMRLTAALARQIGGLPLGDAADTRRAAIPFELSGPVEGPRGGAVAAAIDAAARGKSAIASALANLGPDERLLAQRADAALTRLTTALAALPSSERE